jgi:hypothetical protein
MNDLSRRFFLRGAAAIGFMPAVAAQKQEAHRFRTADFDIEMAVAYHDEYTSRGFWFRGGDSHRQFCLSARGEENHQCVADFRGSLAIAQYRIRPRSRDRWAPGLRELVRTVDRDPRLRDRPPFGRTIALQKGVASDLQVFGYEAAPEEESLLRLHGPWYLFRQDLFLEPQQKPFLAIFWKHALPSIRVLDIIPGEQTWPATK